MYFLIVGTDAPASAARRQELRPRHVAYWQSLADRMKLGGPLLDSALPDAPAKGSMLLIEADDLAAAEAIAQGDPFTGAVFDSVTVTPMRISLGVWPPAD
jgi:uncharacterized protein YciI